MKKGILKVTLPFLFLFSSSSAEFSLPLILKYPFTNRVYLDTLTNEMVYYKKQNEIQRKNNFFA